MPRRRARRRRASTDADLARDRRRRPRPGRPGDRARSPSRSTSAGATSPLRDALEARLGRPCVVENDARAAAIGLHRARRPRRLRRPRLPRGRDRHRGRGRPRRPLHRGARGLAGEIGHAIADRDGPVCACGQHGCLEAFVVGPGDRPPRARRSTPATAQRRPLDRDRRDVYAPRRRRPARRELVDDVGRRLAWAVHLLVMTYDVERVVIGGGVSHAGAPFCRADPARAGRGCAPRRALARPSCCRRTSSRSCHPEPMPGPGAP